MRHAVTAELGMPASSSLNRQLIAGEANGRAACLNWLDLPGGVSALPFLGVRGLMQLLCTPAITATDWNDVVHEVLRPPSGERTIEDRLS